MGYPDGSGKTIQGHYENCVREENEMRNEEKGRIKGGWGKGRGGDHHKCRARQMRALSWRSSLTVLTLPDPQSAPILVPPAHTTRCQADPPLHPTLPSNLTQPTTPQTPSHIHTYTRQACWPSWWGTRVMCLTKVWFTLSLHWPQSVKYTKSYWDHSQHSIQSHTETTVSKVYTVKLRPQPLQCTQAYRDNTKTTVSTVYTIALRQNCNQGFHKNLILNPANSGLNAIFRWYVAESL